MKDGERERPIENYGKKEQKEWLDNTIERTLDLHIFSFVLAWRVVDFQMFR